MARVYNGPRPARWSVVAGGRGVVLYYRPEHAHAHAAQHPSFSVERQEFCPRCAGVGVTARWRECPDCVRYPVVLVVEGAS